MRTLSLMRHAKSSWVAAGPGEAPAPDRLRPLAPRGLRDAPRMAAWMVAHQLRPDLVLCSTATRTRQTLDGVNATLAVAPQAIHFSDALYLADGEDVIAAVQNCADDAQHVLVIGHDPGVHDAACLLTGAGDPPLRRLLEVKFPTAGLAVIDFPAAHWRDIAEGQGRLRHFMAPKRLEA